MRRAPIRGRPGDPAAVHVGHRPALRPRLGRRLAPREPEPRRRPARRCSPRPTWSWSASSAAAGTGRTGIDAVLASGKPVVALGGEQAPDAEMMELSTVPAGVAAQAHTYLAQGGPGEPRPAARLPLRHRAAHRRGLRAARSSCRAGGSSSATARPSDGPTDRRPLLPRPAARRQHRLRRGAVHRRRRRRGPRASRLLRLAAPGRARAAARRCARPTRWSSPCSPRAGRSRRAPSAGGDDEAWDVAELAALDVPILQGLCLTSSRATLGGAATTGSRRSTSPPRSPCPSSTAG